jgi:hypothetical protein
MESDMWAVIDSRVSWQPWTVSGPCHHSYKQSACYPTTQRWRMQLWSIHCTPFCPSRVCLQSFPSAVPYNHTLGYLSLTKPISSTWNIGEWQHFWLYEYGMRFSVALRRCEPLSTIASITYIVIHLHRLPFTVLSPFVILCRPYGFLYLPFTKEFALFDHFRNLYIGKKKSILYLIIQFSFFLCFVKVKSKGKAVPLQAWTDPGVDRGTCIALFLRELGARRGCVISITPRPLYPRERPGTHCTRGWVGPGPVWTCAKNLAPTGIRSPDRPVCSQSLYRLSYPDHMRS